MLELIKNSGCRALNSSVDVCFLWEKGNQCHTKVRLSPSSPLPQSEFFYLHIIGASNKTWPCLPASKKCWHLRHNHPRLQRRLNHFDLVLTEIVQVKGEPLLFRRLTHSWMHFFCLCVQFKTTTMLAQLSLNHGCLWDQVAAYFESPHLLQRWMAGLMKAHVVICIYMKPLISLLTKNKIILTLQSIFRSHTFSPNTQD